MATKGDNDHRRWLVSRTAHATWRYGSIHISPGAAGTELTTENPDMLSLLHAFAKPRTITDVAHELAPRYERPDLLSAIEKLIDSRILISADEPVASIDHWPPNSLTFHRASRGSPAERPAQPGLSPPMRGRLELSTLVPSSRDRDFVSVLDSRRSRRRFGRTPIPRGDFSDLLWLSSRNQNGDRVAPQRPYPSGGGLHTLELYAVLAGGAVESLQHGVYRYEPSDHTLEPLSTDEHDSRPFLEAAASSADSETPPVVLVVTSEIARVTAAYGDLGYSLVLKEVGALFQTLYLVAAYLDLEACALGAGTPEPLLARLTGRSGLAHPIVGEFMLGTSRTGSLQER